MAVVHRFPLICLAVLLTCSGCADYSQNGAPNYSFVQLKTMGERYLSAGDTALALKYLLMAERKRSDVPSLQYDLGLAYGSRKLEGKAIQHLEKALALKPDLAEASNALGVLYAEKGELDKAQRAFETALAVPTYQTPFYAVFNIGLLDERRQDWQGALDQYQKAVAMQSNYAQAYYRMGLMLEHLNRPRNALHAYEEAFDNDPNLAEAYFRYGQLSYRLGDVQQTALALRRVIELQPYSNMAEAARKTLDAVTAERGS